MNFATRILAVLCRFAGVFRRKATELVQPLRALCLRHRASADAARESPGLNGVLKGHPPEKLLTICSFPKASSEWGYTASRYQGPKRGSSAKDAALRQGRMATTSELLFPRGIGSRILPDNVGEAARLRTGRGATRIKQYCGDQLGGLEMGT